MANQKVIQVGVLGAGHHSATTHGPALREIARRRKEEKTHEARERDGTDFQVELAAVCDLDRAKAHAYASDFGFRNSYTSLREMVDAEQLDALFLITPLKLTERIALEAFPLGIPLLIEKPPGATLDETRRLVSEVRRTGTPHMVSFNRRFNPALRHAIDWIARDPERRTPRTVIARMLRHNRREADFATGTGIHLIDAVIALMGKPSRVTSANSPLDAACRFFNARLSFSNDRSASIAIAPACGRHEETIEAYGEDFSIAIDHFANRFRLYREKKIVEEWEPPSSEHPKLADVIGETEHFLSSLGEKTIHPNLEDGLISMECATAIQNGTDERIREA